MSYIADVVVVLAMLMSKAFTSSPNALQSASLTAERLPMGSLGLCFLDLTPSTLPDIRSKI